MQNLASLAKFLEEHMNLRKACAALALSLTLAMSVFAGDIDCPGVVSLPPPTATSSEDITTTLILTFISLIQIP
jgi:hypothetical protein